MGVFGGFVELAIKVFVVLMAFFRMEINRIVVSSSWLNNGRKFQVVAWTASKCHKIGTKRAELHDELERVEYEKVHRGDHFFMLRVGKGKTGVVIALANLFGFLISYRSEIGRDC